MTKPKPRAVKWRFPTKLGSDKVQRSACNRYELIESPAKAGPLFTVVINPEARGTFEFRPLYVERSRDQALDKLDAFEAERLKASEPSVKEAA